MLLTKIQNTKYKIQNYQGYTLLELLIVMALLGILLALLFWIYPKQINKAYDARKKEDLDKLRIALQEYYNDHQCYPKDLQCGQDFSPYLETIPCDPKTGLSYQYIPESEVDCPGWFRLYTSLDLEEDPVIEKLGCVGGVDPTGEGIVYNYGVSSTNVNVCEHFLTSSPPPAPSAGQSPTPSASPTCSLYTSCFGKQCNVIDPTETSCQVYFCNGNCNGVCWACPPGGCTQPTGEDGTPGDSFAIAEKQCYQ